MTEQTAERTAFGRVLARIMEARGMTPTPEAIRDLAERSGLDAEKFVATATSDPRALEGPLTGLDDELGLSRREMQALSDAYVFGDRDRAGDDPWRGWTPQERAAYDARAELEAHRFARRLVEPCVAMAREIGHDEFTHLMEKALAEVEGAVAAGEGRLERAESAAG